MGGSDGWTTNDERAKLTQRARGPAAYTTVGATPTHAATDVRPMRRATSVASVGRCRLALGDAPPRRGPGARRPSWRPVHASAIVLYVCIPTYNEAVTVGVLLWRLRTTFGEQASGRDYELVVYDDASSDATADVLAPYDRIVPLTLLRGEAHLGQSAAVDTLVRHVVSRSRAPETDALLLLQADYTDVPDLVGDMLPLFDAGADLVLTRRVAAPDQPLGERRLRRAAPIVFPPLVRLVLSEATARDPIALLSTLRLWRVSVLRDALGAAGSTPLVRASGWAGTAELLIRTAPFARRIERVEAPARFDVRTRASRIDWTRELRAIAALLWQQRNAARGAARVAARVRASDHLGPRRTDDLPAATTIDSAAGDVAVDRTTSASSLEADRRTTTLIGVPDPTAVGDAGEGDATPRPGRRRRRGRSRQGAPDTAAALPTVEAVATDPDVSGPLEIADGPEPATDASEPDGTDTDRSDTDRSDADAAAAAPAKRRRRRGGARRRARGPELDSGVPPTSPDASATPWQGASSDQQSS